MPGAVFLSYASQDTEAARKLCEALRAVGVEVWFDQSELRGGDAWDQKIRKQIKECALFMPVISANTQQRHEGYFRLEWHLAEQRSHLIARGRPFIVPVSVDDTRDTDALVPDAFLAVQWMRLAQGEATPAFCERVKGLLSRDVAPVSDRRLGTAPATDAGHRPALPAKRKPVWPWIIAAIVALPVLYLIFKPRRSPEEMAKIIAEAQALGERTAAQAAAAAEFPRDPELKRAVKLIYSLNAIETDFALAEDIVKPVLASRPNDPEVVIVAAMVAQEYLTRGFDTSDARRATVQKLAERAVQLAPDNPDALAAMSRYLAYMRTQLPRAEELIRRAIALRPEESRYYRNLLEVYTRSKTSLEVEAFIAQMVARFPTDALVRYDLARSYKDRNDLAAMEKALDETVALGPVAFAFVWKSWVRLAAHGDVAGMKAALDRVPDRQRTNTRVANALSAYGTISGDTAAAIKLVSDLPDTWLSDFNFNGPKALLLGDLLTAAGRKDPARLQYEAAFAEIQREKARNPTDLRLRIAEMWTLLGLGRREEAHALLPLALEAYQRPYRVTLNNSWWSGPVRASLLLDEREQALTLFKEAVVDPQSRLLLRNCFKVDPRMAPFRDDVEVNALLAEPVAEKTEDRGQKTEVSAPIDQKSVAVLAFANLSDDKNNEYFSDGISEELLNVLAKVPGLKVTARTSSFHFKGKDTPIPEIAKQLGVAYVVEGSVRKAGDKVRITAQLIKAADGFHVWSDTFTRDLKDIFAVQDEIAGLIAKNLQLKLGGAARVAQVVNPEAHQLYLQGKYFLNQYSHDNAQRAADLLQRAVGLDPDFALAWAALSRSHSVRGGYADSLQEVDESFALARRAAERALALDPDLAAGHLALAEVRIDHDYDWKGAAESLRRAQALAPTEAAVIDTATRLAYATGQRERAAELGGQAVALDPVNPALRIYYGFALNAARRFPEAEAQFRRVIELNPTIPWGHAGVSFTLTAQGRFDEAAAEAALETNEWSRLTTLAMARWGQKKLPEADAVLAQLIKSNADVAAYQIAEVQAFRGDHDRAFEWLERAYRQRDAGLAWSKSDLSLENLHADPRWEAFMRKLGLADDQLK